MSDANSCAHAKRTEGRCVACGDCQHDVILNGACLCCGVTEFATRVEPPAAGRNIVPLARLRRSSKEPAD